jgi:acyl-CoA synthetase (AMP-forming)/AMP-acid ligase II
MASYGLAEATLFVAGTPRGKGIPALRVNDQALTQNRAEPGEGSPIMSCGISQPDHAVLIVEPRHSLLELRRQCGGRSLGRRAEHRPRLLAQP